MTPNVSDDVYFQKIDEFSSDSGGRLGRHIQHDPASRRYAFDTSGITVTPVRHTRNVPVFDQGDLGSCTGNAAVGSVATDPLYEQLTSAPTLDETLAVKTYSLATTLDSDPDNYPPTDTGSTGIAAAKALVKLGLVAGYQHTFSFTDFLKALSVGPVMLGINWYDSFDNPDNAGLIKIASGAQVRGGHEIYADEITSDQRIGVTNSWTDTWGLKGRAYFSFATVERLLSEQGDATVPVAGTSPVTPTPSPTPTPTPTPSPAPTPSPDDLNLLSAMMTWAKAKGLS